MYGPIHFAAVGFDSDEVVEGLLEELDLVRELGIMRVIDMMLIEKDRSGEITILKVSDYTDRERMEFGAVIGGLIGYGAAGDEGLEAGAILGATAVSENDFGITQEHVIEAIEDIPNRSSAMLILFEHTWALRIKRYMLNHNGFLISQGLLHPAALVSLGNELAKAVALEEEREKEEEMLDEKASKKSSKKVTSTKDVKKKSSKKLKVKNPEAIPTVK